CVRTLTASVPCGRATGALCRKTCCGGKAGSARVTFSPVYVSRWRRERETETGERQPGRRSVDVHHLAAVTRRQGPPRLDRDVRRDAADAAVAKGDLARIVQAPQGRQAAQALAADVRPGVVGLARGGEGALQEAAVHPAGAAVAGDVLAVLELLHAAVVLQVGQGV